MPLSADSATVSISPETVYGQTDKNPTFEIMLLTGESVVAEVQTTNSALMGAGREIQDSILQSLSAAGDITTELAITPAMKILLESAMLNSFVAFTTKPSGFPANIEETVIGNTTKSFTFERRIPNPAGGYFYQRATGCVVNSVNFSVSAGEAATISLSIIGKAVTTGTAILAGATYNNPPNPIVLRGPDTMTMGIGSSTVTTDCAGDFNFTLNNNFRGIQCLGTLGNRSVVEGKAEIELGSTVMFRDNSLIDLLIAQTDFPVDFEMKTDTGVDPGAFFGTHFPRVKLTGNPVSASSTGDDIVNALSMKALKNIAGTNATLGTDDYDQTSMRLVIGSGALTP